MTHRGQPVDVGAIADIAILAIEGERDDISGIGQTKAALTIAKGLSADKKKYLMAKGVGHYGIFNGRKWREDIATVVEKWIRAHVGTRLMVTFLRRGGISPLRDCLVQGHCHSLCGQNGTTE